MTTPSVKLPPESPSPRSLVASAMIPGGPQQQRNQRLGELGVIRLGSNPSTSPNRNRIQNHDKETQFDLSVSSIALLAWP